MTSKALLIKEYKLHKELRLRRSRESFWEYCKTKNPIFFKKERKYLFNLANVLQDLYEGNLKSNNKPCRKLMLNIPPRHGKTYMISMFNQWLLGKNKQNRVLTTSYNDTLSSRFAKSVRDSIQETNESPLSITYNDIFPETKIKKGDAAYHLWSLEGSYMNFLASSFNGTLTGFGGNVGIIDDPIKNAKEANNKRLLEEHYEWYANTFLSRLEENAIQIIVMTRWSDDDLCGKILSVENDWFVYKLEVYHETNIILNEEREDFITLEENNLKMLCPELMSYDSYQDKAKHMSTEILQANYHQNPINIIGRLYKNLKTYERIPESSKKPLFEAINCYVDTADTGEDYLCAIVYGVYQGYAYILDVLYTQDPQEITEPATADLLIKHNVRKTDIESNSGGRAFARNVERIVWERYKKRLYIESFHQSENKEARIVANSATVQNIVLFPIDWKNRFPVFYNHITTFQRNFKANAHDDCADALTGIVEKINVSTSVIIEETEW